MADFMTISTIVGKRETTCGANRPEAIYLARVT